MRLPLYVASAFLSVIMLTGTVQAETTSKSSTQPAAAAEQQKTTKSDRPRLSDEKYKIYKDAMAKARNDSKQINEQIKAKRKELATLMSAEQFNRAAFLAKDAEVQELIAKTARAKAEALATAAEKLSVQDRKILAERLEKRRGSHSKRSKDKKTNEKIAP